ncbi:uncharacterized protein CDAR_416281 [Caerostris darwini]|uniref:Uncharacterized protein n=1 Tax=Caerostris darwini TaxID=1538125 RepID=A0AAV4W5L4_9ARAC|nr:uncharacterized protein CDAR_416281 [Caerostris darwini]
MVGANQWNALLLFLAVATSSISSSYGEALDSQQISDTIEDLLRLESSNPETIVKPDARADEPIVEESKDSVVFRSSKRLKKNSPGYKIKVQNITDEKYNLLQWYSTPEDVNHHVDGKETNDTDDLNAQGTSYSEGYSHDHDHDHIRYYSGDDQPPEDTRYNEGMIHSFHHQGSSDVDLLSDKPRSTSLGKSRRKKGKKPCSRKGKKSDNWPERSDTIVHGMSKHGPEISHYSSNKEEIPDSSVEGRDNISPKPSSGFTPLLPPLGFSAERLHGIGTYFSSQRTKGNENHFHLHNHHHYKPDEKKFSERDPMESYDKIFKSLGKLRNVIPTMLSGMSGALPQLGQTSTSSGSDVPKVMNADVKFATEGEKKGYHYTGPHKAYGRKTYIRMKNENEESGDSNTDYPSSYENQQAETGGYGYGTSNSGPNYPESEMNMHDHAVDMFKYGTGPYGTDEYRDGKGRFPNEVNLNVDKIHPGIGFDSPPGGAPHSGYNSESAGPYEPYHDYPSSFHSDRNKESEEGKHSPDYHEKAPYVPYDQIQANRDKSFEGGYGHRQNSPDIPENSNSYNGPAGPHTYDGPENPNDYRGSVIPHSYNGPEGPHSYNRPEGPHSYNGPESPHSYDGPESPHSYDGPTEGKSYSDPPIHSSAEGHSGSPHVTSHTVSYSHQGDRATDSHHLDPQEELFRNARPDLDPLSIPRNAQIIEHFIRLDPVHYTPPRIPMEFIPGAGFQVHPAPPGTGFTGPQAAGTSFHPQNFRPHIPVHKLIPNPLKMPYPVMPRAASHPHPQINQMLQAYQSRSFYHRWW